jgi:hypothetical protein
MQCLAAEAGSAVVGAQWMLIPNSPVSLSFSFLPSRVTVTFPAHWQSTNRRVSQIQSLTPSKHPGIPSVILASSAQGFC